MFSLLVSVACAAPLVGAPSGETEPLPSGLPDASVGRGAPFGDAAVLERPPLPDCTEGPAISPWTCRHRFGGVPVTVEFLVSGDRYLGFRFGAEGRACSGLLREVQRRWGEGRSLPRDVLGCRTWSDDALGASFCAGNDTDRCAFTVTSPAHAPRVEPDWDESDL